MTGQMKYVLVTPARNEQAFIEKTIESMIQQTLLPLKWVIVDDGSTDNTREIVGRYLAQNPWRPHLLHQLDGRSELRWMLRTHRQDRRPSIDSARKVESKTMNLERALGLFVVVLLILVLLRVLGMV